MNLLLSIVVFLFCVASAHVYPARFNYQVYSSRTMSQHSNHRVGHKSCAWDSNGCGLRGVDTCDTMPSCKAMTVPKPKDFHWRAGRVAYLFNGMTGWSNNPYHDIWVKLDTLKNCNNNHKNKVSKTCMCGGVECDAKTHYCYDNHCTTVPKVDCAVDILNGGWKLVRRVKPGNKWHPAQDQLLGTHVYGTYTTDGQADQTFSMKFNDINFNQFLFSTGNCEKWLVAEKGSVIGGWYSNQNRNIIASSLNSEPYSALWYRRQGSKEDPWVSLNDHGPAIGQGNIVYGENNFGSTHASAVLPQNNGANVYIRQAATCDSFSCPSGQIHIDAALTTQCASTSCTDSDNCCENCEAGFVGDGTSCMECTIGKTAAVSECDVCTQCNSIGQEIHTACTASADAVCGCSIGFAGNEGGCTICQDGSTFTDAPNHTTCRQCSICNADNGQEVATACTTTSNTVCRCRAGFSGDGETCTACTSGDTFTDDSDQSNCITCDPCTEAGQKIEEICTTTSDAVCQCIAGHAGEGSTCIGCVSGETFTHLDDQDTCGTCKTCSVEGQEIGTHCTTTSDTQCRCVVGYAGNGDNCDVCVEGSNFTHIVDQASCTDCDRCDGAGQESATACSTTLDTVCRCTAGFAGDEDSCTVCNDGSSFTNISGELSCQSCNTCQGFGQEIYTQCTTTTDAVCQCSAGFSGSNTSCTSCTSGSTFSTTPGQETCNTCNACDGSGQEIDSECSTTTDAVCMCSAGYAGNSASCESCTLGSSFTVETGEETCSTCNACDLPGQDTELRCTLTSDAMCKCVPGWAGDGNTCAQCLYGYTYASNSDASSCSNCDLCNRDGESVGTQCTPWSNTICVSEVQITTTIVTGSSTIFWEMTTRNGAPLDPVCMGNKELTDVTCNLPTNTEEFILRLETDQHGWMKSYVTVQWPSGSTSMYGSTFRHGSERSYVVDADWSVNEVEEQLVAAAQHSVDNMEEGQYNYDPLFIFTAGIMVVGLIRYARNVRKNKLIDETYGLLVEEEL